MPFFFTVFGIAARNGIMLVSHIQHLMLEEGVTDFREAVERGALGDNGQRSAGAAAGRSSVERGHGDGQEGEQRGNGKCR